MSFLIDFIENIQEKPKEVRQRIMWLVVAVCMLVIFIFWGFSLKYSVKKTIEESPKTNLVPDEIGNSVQQMQNEWQDVKNKPSSNLPNVFEKQENAENPFE